MAFIKESDARTKAGGGRALPPINRVVATKAPAASAAYTNAARNYLNNVTGVPAAAAKVPVGFTGSIAQTYASAQKNNAANYNGGGGGGGGASYSDAYNDEYYAKLQQAKQAGILSEYETNFAVIKNNLAKALSNLQAEKAALAPVYQNQLSSIAQNQFGSQEQMKEIMNQSGWNGQNSGLAIGEQGKIKIGADNARAEAGSVYAQGIADVERRTSLTNETSGNELVALDKWKNAQMAGAEAETYVSRAENIAAAAKAAQNYQAKLSTASTKQQTTNDKVTAAAMTANAKKASADGRRSALADATAAYREGDTVTLTQILDELALDDTLSAEDYEDVNGKILTWYTSLTKKTGATTPDIGM
jgi:hypothetical protein